MTRCYLFFFKFLASLLLVSPLACGQKSPTDWATRCEDTEAMFVGEVMAKYPGGIEIFLEDLKSNINLGSGSNTDFHLQFGINCKGEIYRLDFFDCSLSEEDKALFIQGFKKMNKWSPAKQGDKPIDSIFSLKIHIKNGQILRPKKK